MGFTLFDQSGTFNPAAYGLAPGDVVHVIVVGGGGGGCYGSNTSAYGGNGGSSSFGSYVTALGGYGAKYNQTNPWRNTPTQYMTVGAIPGPSMENYTMLGGSGGGGWYPGYKRGNGHSWSRPNTTIQGSQYGYFLYGVDGDIIRDTGGTPGRYYYNSSTSYFAFNPDIKQTDVWSPYILSYSAQNIHMQFLPVLPVAGGCGLMNNNSYYDLTPYPRSSNCRSYVQGNGGLGYGAGGGSNSPSAYTAGGCGGELREGDVVLTSASNIAITVGGGGAGGIYATSSSQYLPGGDGGAGVAGTAATSYACPGGYGTMIPKPASVYTSTSYKNYVAGGGAGGCVAIWW